MAQFGITQKILGALVVSSTLAVIITAGIMQWSIHRGFMQYIDTIEHDGVPRLVQSLEQEYAASKGWETLRSQPQRWRQLTASSLYNVAHPDLLPSAAEPPPPPDMLPPHVALQFDRRLFLAGTEKEILIGEGPIGGATLLPITCDRIIIGYLGLRPQKQPVGAAQQKFLKQQHKILLVAAGIVIALSTLLSLFIARRIVRPIKILADATRSLSSGEYHIRVPVVSHDELGRLATDFNALALALEHNEGVRRRWVADISHELRTPLTFLRSQVEAILDGVRQPTGEAIRAIHNEIMGFARLVDDLHQLSMSDVGAQTYRKEILDLSESIQQVVSLIEPQFTAKEIAIQCEAEGDATVFGDSVRLHQLFGNLLDNSLKYTDPCGLLRIRVRNEGGKVVVDLQDSAPGVPEAELDRLFEWLYRVDSSRSRSTGGSGLGLAICRNIIEAHEGIILAKQSPLGGLWIRIEAPLYESVR